MTAAEDRIERVRRELPHLLDPDEWARAFTNPEVLGLAIRDVMRVGFEPAKRGQRAIPDVATGMARWAELVGEDYATVPFPEAFQALAGTKSVRWLATKTHMSASKIQRLRHGRAAPSMEDLTHIAAAFGKPPTWFHEYRVNYIAAAVAAALETTPERSAIIVNHMQPGQ